MVLNIMKNMPVPVLVEKRADGIDLTPTRGSELAVGYDLRANIEQPWVIEPGVTCLVPTGVRFDLNKYFPVMGLVFPRSGLGSREGLVLGNLTGVIDPDYQGEIKIALWNRNLPGEGDYEGKRLISPGDRIAQIVFIPAFISSLDLVDAFSAETARGEAGFGSTGKQ